MTQPTKIVIVGAGGRMGRALIAQIAGQDGAELVGATERPESDLIGRDAGELAGVNRLGVALTADPLPAIVGCDAVIDFTSPAATVEHATLTAQARCVHVIGTTGLDADQEAALHAAARHAVIVKAGNMSLGVNLLPLLNLKDIGKV